MTHMREGPEVVCYKINELRRICRHHVAPSLVIHHSKVEESQKGLDLNGIQQLPYMLMLIIYCLKT